MTTVLNRAREALTDLAPRVYGGDVLEKVQQKIATVLSHDDTEQLLDRLAEDYQSLTKAREQRLREVCADLDADATASRLQTQLLASRYTDAVKRITTEIHCVKERMAATIDAQLSELAFGRIYERRLSFLSKPSRSPEELSALLTKIVRDCDAHLAEVIERHLTELMGTALAVVDDLPLTEPLPVPHADDLPTLASFVDTRSDSNGLQKIVAGLQGAFFFGNIAQFFANKQLLAMPPAMLLGAGALVLLVRRYGAKEAANIYKSALPPAVQAYKQALLACVQTRCEAFEADAKRLLCSSQTRGVRRFEIETARIEEEQVAATADALAHTKLCGDVTARIHALKEQLQYHHCLTEEERR